MPFEVERSTLDSGIMVLALSGTMTMGNQLQQLEWAVQDLAKAKQNKIVLDMSRITYLDSSAIGVLVGCHGLVRDSGGQLRLAGVTTRVGTIFKMSGVDAVLSVDPTRDHAVSVLAPKP
ncbi:MAG TPA: STAS domain-containing protein [Bryobacteraceae bacterium]|nr:STAS domain-containing protein [Bryobacteraceae bacterium]